MSDLQHSVQVLERAAATLDTLEPVIAEHLKLHEQSLDLRHLAKELAEGQPAAELPLTAPAAKVTRSMLVAGMDAAHDEGLRVTFAFLSKLYSAMATAQPVKR